MPTRGKPPQLLVDTSVAVPLCVVDHEFHHLVTRTVRDRRLGLAGHAAFEAFSVLTRMPPPARRTAPAVARLLVANFPASRFLSVEAAEALFESFDSGLIAGGSVYDALVGSAAKEHDVTLATLDRGARDTYEALRVDVEWVVGDAGQRG